MDAGDHALRVLKPQELTDLVRGVVGARVMRMGFPLFAALLLALSSLLSDRLEEVAVALVVARGLVDLALLASARGGR